MMWWLLNKWEDRGNWEIIVVFANTGLEASETLVFVHQCSWRWKIPIVWVEAVPVKSKAGKWWGVTHKVVDYFSAAQDNKLVSGGFRDTPFEQMISKLGIPSTNAPFCSDQLKTKACKSYAKSIGWTKYHIAIGIRTDEVDRVREDWRRKRIVYFLITHFPVDKPYIIEWFKTQKHDLAVHEDEGNCKNCWKKDMPRLVRNAKRNPKSFDWWQAMTDKYGHLNPRNTHLKPPFNFYRGNISPRNIFELARKTPEQIELFSSEHKLIGCGESCEAF